MALRKEMDIWARDPRISSLVFDTLYIGGGTPTCLPPDELISILHYALEVFPWCDGAREITVEANPETLDREYIVRLHKAGVTRLSVGLQALSDRGLRVLGRGHGVNRGIKAMEWAKDEGLSVSVDLIYGWPGQDTHEWKGTLEEIAHLRPEHLSCYELTLEPGTLLWEQVNSGTLQLPDEDLVLRLWDMVSEVLAPEGYRHYEISNYCLAGNECQHNLKYWKGAPYLGVGCSASSYVYPARWTNSKNVRTYMRGIASGEMISEIHEVLDRDARFREAVVIGLRLVRGVNRGELVEKWGIDPVKYYGDTLYSLQGQGLLRMDNEVIQLTGTGRRVANAVMAELV